MGCGVTHKPISGNGQADSDWADASGTYPGAGDDCTGTCQGQGGKPGVNVQEDDNLNWNEDFAQKDCSDGCEHACASCANVCGGSSCTNGCKGGCQGCGDSCAGCGGACSSSCSGCRGGCDGGCEGSCQTECNAGCEGGEMEEGLGLKIDRVINIANIKKVFEFVVYLVNMRTNNSINIEEHFVEIDKWLEEIKDLNLSNVDMTASLLYYTMPRVFENAFKEVNKNPSIQSGWLDKNKEYAPTIDINVDNFKYYADKISAQEWLDIAFDLYDDVVGIYDGD